MSELKMDSALKAKWLDALRSGPFIQGRGYLERNGEHCCLGVLCAIQDNEWKRYWDDEESLYTEALPVPLSAGLRSDECETLASMNDNGEPFSVIADYIEANL
jgi:hypothetical protein